MKKNLKLSDVQYVKITYDDRWDNRHCSKAAIKSATNREITISIKYEDYIFVKAPQKVELGFVCEDGIYKTNSNLKSIENNEPYIMFHIEMPQNIEYQQNREYFRVNILEGAILSFDSPNGSTRITCKTHDISAKGVSLELQQKIDIPEKVNISILFTDKELNLPARLVWTMVQEETVRASFEFIDITEQEIDFISKICIQKQLEIKREKVD